MELKSRAEMDPKYMWDLTPIFPNDQAWEDALKQATEAVKTLSAIPGTLGNSLESFKDGLDKIYAVTEQIERVANYAFLKKSGDNGDTKNQEMEARCISLLTAFQSAVAFLNPEILDMDSEKLDLK